MRPRSMPGTTVSILAMAGLAAACTGGAARSATPVATPSPATFTVQSDVSFESANPLNQPGVLDVYAPVDPGPWPVVVMFHGDPSFASKGSTTPFAQHVADRGFVVFAPTWGHSGGAAYDALSLPDRLGADLSQAACAVAFAQRRAPDYGGDPERVILFGHSAGGNIAAVLGFAAHEPTDGCLADERPAPVEAVVAFEGDWVLGDPSWDSALVDEPTIYAMLTPWLNLADRPDLPLHLLASSAPGLGRTDGEWVEARDPSGSIRRAFDAIGALDDEYVGLDEVQAMLARMLEGEGHPVTFRVLPQSTHMALSEQGWQVFESLFEDLAL